jgi:SAM-dependent methyltransferase
VRPAVQQKEWFERWFGEEYKALYPHRDAAQAAVQVEALTRAAGALPAWSILDVGCGAGRHLQAFKNSGLRAVGVDLSPVLTKDARVSGLDVARADMRRLPFRAGTFDLVACFFTSFGYFATAEEDLAVLAGFRDLVRPTGLVFLDLPNATRLAESLVPGEVLQLAGRHVEVERRIEGDAVVKRMRILCHPSIEPDENGQDETFEERVRLYPPDRLEPLLRDLGLETVRIFGDETGGPFDPAVSSRMSLLLRCPS